MQCDQVQIIALTEALGVRVSIQYLDGRPFDAAAGLGVVELGGSAEGDAPFTLSLLYRPGHYDVLYPTA
jgi:ubiquitin thioesterase protein OTUB1